MDHRSRPRFVNEFLSVLAISRPWTMTWLPAVSLPLCRPHHPSLAYPLMVSLTCHPHPRKPPSSLHRAENALLMLNCAPGPWKLARRRGYLPSVRAHHTADSLIAGLPCTDGSFMRAALDVDLPHPDCIPFFYPWLLPAATGEGHALGEAVSSVVRVKRGHHCHPFIS